MLGAIKLSPPRCELLLRRRVAAVRRLRLPPVADALDVQWIRFGPRPCFAKLNTPGMALKLLPNRFVFGYCVNESGVPEAERRLLLMYSAVVGVTGILAQGPDARGPEYRPPL